MFHTINTLKINGLTTFIIQSYHGPIFTLNCFLPILNGVIVLFISSRNLLGLKNHPIVIHSKIPTSIKLNEFAQLSTISNQFNPLLVTNIIDIIPATPHTARVVFFFSICNLSETDADTPSTIENALSIAKVNNVK